MRLRDLVAAADGIALVAVTSERIYEPAAEVMIETEYAADVYEIFHVSDRIAMAAGDEIVVRREGGTLEVDGQPFTVQNDRYPPLRVSDEYVLFLTRIPDGRYEVLSGQGAFHLDAERHARQLIHVSGEIPEEFPLLDGPIGALRARIVDAVRVVSQTR